jgi:hypothetical protein
MDAVSPKMLQNIRGLIARSLTDDFHKPSAYPHFRNVGIIDMQKQ